VALMTRRLGRIDKVGTNATVPCIGLSIVLSIMRSVDWALASFPQCGQWIAPV
jgi:hypothetical protein